MNYRPERSKPLEFQLFSRLKVQKSNQLVSRFLAIFTNLWPEGMNFSLDLTSFTNLRRKRTELFILFFFVFSLIWDRKVWTYFLIFGYFHEFETRNERTYFSILGYFLKFETRKEGTYFSIFLLIFTNLRPEENEPISRFLTIFSNLSPEENELISRCLAIFTILRPIFSLLSHEFGTRKDSYSFFYRPRVYYELTIWPAPS